MSRFTGSALPSCHCQGPAEKGFLMASPTSSTFQGAFSVARIKNLHSVPEIDSLPSLFRCRQPSHLHLGLLALHCPSQTSLSLSRTEKKPPWNFLSAGLVKWSLTHLKVRNECTEEPILSFFSAQQSLCYTVLLSGLNI